MNVSFIHGDITQFPAEVIVNAANSQLMGGGGVDGAIHRAAGPAVMAELDEIRPKIGRCAPGDIVVTSAGRLNAQYIVHAVGPIYRDGKSGEPDLLASCYSKSLRWADGKGLKSIAFPAISTGVYGYPMDEAAAIAVRVTKDFSGEAGSLEQVTFVLFSERALAAFESAWGRQ